ncbi:hypothetical protein EJJ20_31135 [Pseudomonas poae]|nr:hypothetical protein EJJ20_31135 [Pseudomonas poae]
MACTIDNREDAVDREFGLAKARQIDAAVAVEELRHWVPPLMVKNCILGGRGITHRSDAFF